MITAKTGATTVTTPSDLEVVLTRVFNAPRTVLFDVWTNTKHLPKWLTGPAGWEMPICELDLRPGGKWRYVYRKASGKEMTIAGTVLEVVPPERFVTTESWGPEWPETTNRAEFTESNGRTTVTVTTIFVSKEARDAALATGMNSGVDASYDRLDELLAELTQ